MKSHIAENVICCAMLFFRDSEDSDEEKDPDKKKFEGALSGQ